MNEYNPILHRVNIVCYILTVNIISSTRFKLVLVIVKSFSTSQITKIPKDSLSCNQYYLQKLFKEHLSSLNITYISWIIYYSINEMTISYYSFQDNIIFIDSDVDQITLVLSWALQLQCV